jgi:uncharacterized caspase-like protein
VNLFVFVGTPDFNRRLQTAGPSAVGFFYYSGHGASDGSTNYLIPIDVKTTETGDLWDQSLQLTEITRKLKKDAANATHFVVFDACRNTLRLTQPCSRAVVQSKGFVPVAQENGMLITYSTAEGELASDVGTGAGPYAKVLAEEVVKPGIEAVAMFRIVQRRVRAAIRQEPYLGFSALGDVYFASNAKPPEPPSTQARPSDAAEAWGAIKDTTNIAVLEAYIARFKTTYYADLARLRIEELKKQEDNQRLPTAAKTKSQIVGTWYAEVRQTGQFVGRRYDFRRQLTTNRLDGTKVVTFHYYANGKRLPGEKVIQMGRRWRCVLD